MIKLTPSAQTAQKQLTFKIITKYLVATGLATPNFGLIKSVKAKVKEIDQYIWEGNLNLELHEACQISILLPFGSMIAEKQWYNFLTF